MFEQIFKQSREIKLIPDGYGNYEVTCLTDLKDKDKEESYEAEFTFPKVTLDIKGKIKPNVSDELYYVKVLD